MLFWPLNPIHTQIPNSPTSITQGQGNFPSSLATISDFLNLCFFYLWPHKWLIFGLLDLDYQQSNQVSITLGHYSWLMKSMFFWPLNPIYTQIRTPWPRKRMVRLNSTHHWTLLRVSKTDIFSTFDPDLYSNSDSLTSKTYGPTKSQPSLVTISGF